MTVKEVERQIPLSRAKSRTVFEKLSKSSTVTDLKNSESTNKLYAIHQPVLKDQILVPQKELCLNVKQTLI